MNREIPSGVASDSAALVDEVLLFIALAWEVDDLLRSLLAENGAPRLLPTLAHAGHDSISQVGEVPGVGEYYFHGIGCAVDLGGRGESMSIGIRRGKSLSTLTRSVGGFRCEAVSRQAKMT